MILFRKKRKRRLPSPVCLAINATSQKKKNDRSIMQQNPNSLEKMKEQMETTQKLFLFFVVMMIALMGYNIFYVQPQTEAVRQAQQQERAQAIAEGRVPGLTDPAQMVRERDEVLVEAERIIINNPELKGSISLLGGAIDDVSLKNYFRTLDKKENVTILSPRETAFPRFAEFGWITGNENIALPDRNTQWRVTGNSAELDPENPVTLVWENGQGLTFRRTLELDDRYVVTITQEVVNSGAENITLFPYGLITQRGVPEDLQNAWILHEGPLGYINDELIEKDYGDSFGRENTVKTESDFGWIGITDKYWLSGLIPAQGQSTSFGFRRNPSPLSAQGPDRDLYQTDFRGPGFRLAPGENASYVSHFFVGPKKVIDLEYYEDKFNIPHFDLAVDFGIFYFMSKPFFYLLHWFGEMTGNLGIAIIIITIIIRSAVYPLTNQSYKSFAKMKKVSPQIMELRERVGDNKEQLREELVKLYEKEGVNPVSGCLPLLVQIPIFFALYKVLFVTIEVRHAPFFGWIQDLSAPDPTSLFNLFGLIPWDPPGFLMIGVWPCLMLIIMLLQKQLHPPAQDKIQRDIQNIFPFLIAFLMSGFAAGLVIYWTFSALIGVLQQIIITKRMGMEVKFHLFSKPEEEKKMDEAVEEGPGVHPLVDMVEDDVEEALFDKEEGQPKDITPPKPKKKKKKK